MIAPLKIKCVLLDYGNVLCPRQDPDCVDEMVRLSGVERDVFIKNYDNSRREYDGGGIDGIEYWTRFLGRFDIKGDPALCQALYEADVRSWTPIDDEIITLAFDLQRAGTKIGVLSNMPMEEAQHFKRIHDWMPRFDFLFLSSEMGMVKPDAEIYETVLKAIALPPESVLFIDDKPENIEAARRSGMQGLIYESKEKSFPILADCLKPLLV